MPEENDLFPVVVIGGGLSGLTAAVHLAARGVPPLVLEADSKWPGGRICGGDPDEFEHKERTWSFNPDQGMHAVWGAYTNMRATLARFTDIRLIPSPGEEWINRWGREVRRIEAGNAVRARWLPAPFHYLQLLFHPQIWNTITPLDFLSLPGFLYSLLWAVGYDPIGERNALDGLMMSDYFRGWTPNLRATFTGLGVNLLAAPPESISLSALIAALRFYTVLRRDTWKLQYFPSSPATSMIPSLVNRIESGGGVLMMGATAVQLERLENSWRVIVEDAPKGGRRSVSTKSIILATDPLAAKRILSVSDSTAEVADRIRFPSALRNAVVRLWFDVSPREGAPGGMFTGDFVADNFFWLHRLYDHFEQWHDSTGGSVLEAHIYGSESLMDQSDQHLLILALTDVQLAFPELKGHFVHGTVRRNIRTQTEFRVPTDQSLFVDTPWSGVFACGDWIGYPTPSLWMERSTVTGIAAANRVLAANQIEPYPIIPPKRPELTAIGLGAMVRGIRLLFAPLIRLIRMGRAFVRPRSTY